MIPESECPCQACNAVCEVRGSVSVDSEPKPPVQQGSLWCCEMPGGQVDYEGLPLPLIGLMNVLKSFAVPLLSPEPSQ